MNGFTKYSFFAFLMYVTDLHAKGATTNPLETELIKTLESYNKKMPIAIDKVTRAESATVGPGLVVTYSFTILNAVSTSIDGNIKANIAKKLKPILVTKLCITEESMRLLNQGVILRYVYHLSDGGFLTQFDIKATDCVS